MTRAYNGFFASAKRLQRSFPAVFPRLRAKEPSVINASRRRGLWGRSSTATCRDPCEIGLVIQWNW